MCRINLLGPFTLECGDGRSPARLGRKTRAILAYLAGTNTPHTRPSLYEMFCQTANDPAGALRWHLSRIRAHTSPALIRAGRRHVSLDSGQADVDSLSFQQVISAGTPDPEQLPAALRQWRGEFLADLTFPNASEFDLWVLGMRAQFNQLHERGLILHIDHLIESKRPADAIHWARRLAEHNPLLEEGHRRLSWLYAQAGQRDAALQQIEHCRRILKSELGAEPTSTLADLHRQILAGEFAPLAVAHAVPEIAAPPAPAGFVGRGPELAALRQVWQAAQKGDGTVCLIEAEAGGGKTRLVDVFARHEGAALFAGRSFESSRALPYHPWVELLERRLAPMDAPALEHLSALSLDYLSRLLPSLVRRAPRDVPPPPPTQGGAATRLFQAAAESLLPRPGPARPAAPAIIFLDDLQWADAASLQLFHYIARQVQRAPALLIGAYRPEELDDAAPLHTLIRDLGRDPLLHLRLSPLTLAEVTALTADLWPDLPPGFRPHVCARLAQATGGNPFFLTETIRELALSPNVPDSLPVPATVRDLIRRRLSRLPEGGRQVVEALAVMAAPASPGLVQQISARTEEETITVIELGLRRGLLQGGAGMPGRYDFSHDLVRQAVIEELSAVRRPLLHRRIAQALEGTAEPAATLAYHWRMAGGLDREGHYALLAGERAAELYAHEEAIRYLQRAAQISEAAPDRIRAELKLGAVKQLTGKWEAAEAHIRRALEAAAGSGDAAARARCQAALGGLMTRRGQFREALEILTQAEALCEQIGDQAGTGEAAGALGLVHWYLGDYPQALAHLERRLALAREAGDQKSAGIAIGNLGIVYWSQGDYGQALASYQAKLQMDTAVGDRLSASQAVGNIGLVYRDQGDYAQAMQSYIHKLKIDDEIGDRLGVSFALENMGDLYNRQGDYALALVCLGRSLEIALDLEARQVVSVILGRLIDTYNGLGDLDALERVTRQAIAVGRAVNIPRNLCYALYSLADLLARQGKAPAAWPLAEEAASLARQVQRQPVLFTCELLRIRLRVAMGTAALPAAISELETLRSRWTERAQQAALHDAIWALDSEKAGHRSEAARLYRDLYAQTPDVHYRRRHEALTGEQLPDPAPRPALPESIEATIPDLDRLLKQVAQLITFPEKAPVSS